MKKFTRVAVVMLVLAAMSLIAMACNNAKADSIYVDEADLPQITKFIRGQDIDFFGGMLTVVSGSKVEKVPMDSDEITLTYDDSVVTNEAKTVTVTLGYRGQECTFDITIVPRIALRNVNLDYFEKEEFDRSSGTAVVTHDDFTTETIQIKDENLKIEGYDPNPTMEANKATVEKVQLEYNGYTDTVDVRVHTFKSKDYHVPSKIGYQTHQQLDLAGGYIVYYSTDSFYRQIDLNSDLVSYEGYNPYEATLEENRGPENALSQNVNFVFEGYDWEPKESRGVKFVYPITIEFSDVDTIRVYAEELEDIEYTVDENGGVIYPSATELTAVMLAHAREAVELFKGLEQNTPEDAALITEEERGYIARPVFFASYEQYFKALEEYKDTFTINGLYVNFTLTSREAVEKTFKELTSKDKNQSDDGGITTKVPVFGLNRQLLGLAECSGLLGVPVLTAESSNSLGNMLRNVADFTTFVDRYMPALEVVLKVYDLLDEEAVPENWNENGTTVTNGNGVLSTYKDKIEAAYNYLSGSETSSYRGSSFTATESYRNFYAKMSAWRKNDDYFDIIYRYYYDLIKAEEKNLSDETKKKESQTKIDEYNDKLNFLANNYRMPGEFEDIYSDISSMYTQYLRIAAAENNGTVYETSSFIAHYLDAMDLVKLAKSVYNKDEEKTAGGTTKVAEDPQEGEDEDAREKDPLKLELYNYILNNVRIEGIVAASAGEDAEPMTIEEVLKMFKNIVYNRNAGPLVDTDEFDKLWDEYKDLILKNEEGAYRTTSVVGDSVLTDAFRTDIPAFIEKYIALTPGQRYGFDISFLGWDASLFVNDGTNYYLTLANFIDDYYVNDIQNHGIKFDKDTTPQTVAEDEGDGAGDDTEGDGDTEGEDNGLTKVSDFTGQIILNLFNALNALTHQANSQFLEIFMVSMEDAVDGYTTLKNEENGIELFNAIPGAKALYEQLDYVYNLYKDEDSDGDYIIYQPDLEDTTTTVNTADADADKTDISSLTDKQLLDKFLATARDCNMAAAALRSGYNMYALMIANFERLDALNKILVARVEAAEKTLNGTETKAANDGDGDDEEGKIKHSDLYNAYYYGRYLLSEEEDESENVYYTPEFMMVSIRTYYVSALSAASINYKDGTEYAYDLYLNVDDQYKDVSIKEFLPEVGEFMVSAIFDGDFEGRGIGDDDVKKIIADYVKLTFDQKVMLNDLEQNNESAFDMAFLVYFENKLGYTIDSSNRTGIIDALNNITDNYIKVQRWNRYLHPGDWTVGEPSHDVYLDDVKAYRESVETFYAAYSKLTEDQKKTFEDFFKDMTNIYVEYYEDHRNDSGTTSVTNPRGNNYVKPTEEQKTEGSKTDDQTSNPTSGQTNEQ